MAEYGVTEKGFVMKRFDTILNEVQSDISGALGFDVSQNPQSLLNAALIIPFCDKIAALWEVGQDSYYAKYPSTAEGINLDNACQYGHVFRAANKRTEYIIHCRATDGTMIPKGSLVSSITNPVVNLQCAGDTVVERASCNAIAVKPVVAGAGTYTIELNGNLYSYGASAGATAADIISGLYDAFQVDGYTAVKEKDMLVISDNTTSRSNEVLLTNNLTTEYVVSCVHFLTVEYGDIQCPKGSITKITSNVTGLQAVDNRIEPTAGRIQQDDISFRQDYIRKSYYASSTQTQSIEAAILENCSGVKDVRCYENATNQTDALGRPPHCVEVIVDGGEPEQIAAQILAKKAGGIQAYGDVTVNVLGEYGDNVPISFRRPENIYAWIKVELTGNGGSIAPDYVNIVQSAICDGAKGLSVGDSFLSQTYIAGIYSVLSNISYCKITVAGTQLSSAKPEAYAEGNIAANERQTISVDASRIEVVLKT